MPPHGTPPKKITFDNQTVTKQDKFYKLFKFSQGNI